jgi:hypothetical protein
LKFTGSHTVKLSAAAILVTWWYKPPGVLGGGLNLLHEARLSISGVLGSLVGFVRKWMVRMRSHDARPNSTIP